MTSDKNGFCVYVDTNEFPDDSEIPVKATINEGKPTDKLMYYEIIDTEPKYNNDYTLSLSQATDINLLVVLQIHLQNIINIFHLILKYQN